MSDSTVVTRVALRNYKSIANCDVRLGPLTFLVGPNGSGKSNFVDALRFVSDAVGKSLDDALRERGGASHVRRRVRSGSKSFEIELKLRLGPNMSAAYGLRILPLSRGSFKIQEEKLCIFEDPKGTVIDEFVVRNGTLAHFRSLSSSGPGNETPFADGMTISTEHLFLVAAAIVSPLVNSVQRTLSTMSFYKIVPEHMKLPTRGLVGYSLFPDGGNIASVFRHLEKTNPQSRRIIIDYLSLIVPGLEDIDSVSTVGMDTLEFLQAFPNGHAERFPVDTMSDGAIRALGILVALFHKGVTRGDESRLISIEEPELALHPSATAILLDALRVASYDLQVLVTSHSADLLDDDEIDADSILAVAMDRGTTIIGPIDEIGRQTLRDRLFTSGELLRLDQLVPVGGPARVVPDSTLVPSR